MSMIEFHRKLLGDPIRNRAFHEALRRVVVPGKTTLVDIGAGTGFLSFLAAKLGVKRCYLFEQGAIIAIAREIARANGIRHCEFIERHSHAVRAPVQADVVVSETLGNFAYEERIIENMEDAKRFLLPGGTLIPQKLAQFVAPVIKEKLWREVNVWDTVGFGLDLGPAKDVGLNNMYVKTITPGDIFHGREAAKQWDAIDFRKRNRSVREGTVAWTAAKDVTVYGFALWWECELLPGVRLSTSPFGPLTHWEQIYLPVLAPIHVPARENLELHIRSDTRHQVDFNVSWDVAVRSARGRAVACQELDMRKGYVP